MNTCMLCVPPGLGFQLILRLVLIVSFFLPYHTYVMDIAVWEHIV